LKKFFISKSLNLVKEMNPEYDEDKLDEIRYGLEATYLSLTKLVVILLASFLLGLLKESIILLLFFNGLRITGFGLHASKSWMCWVSSSLVFLVLPYLCSILIIPNGLKIILSIVCIINFILYAPADTVKRPLIHKKRRTIYKIVTVMISIIYAYFVLTTNKTFIQNSLISAMLIEGVLINPFVYKLFRLPYANYKTYKLSTVQD